MTLGRCRPSSEWQEMRRDLRGGWTIIETIVVIGILMILIGLMMPTLGKARQSARQLKSVAALQQNAHLVAMYAADHRETYPIADVRLNKAALYWYQPLITGGYADSPEAVDPEGVRRVGEVTYAMSHCLAYDPDLMQPGKTVPIEFATTTPVRISDVRFPSGKGAFYQWIVAYLAQPEWWCCAGYDKPAAPVAMADNSVMVAKWHEFRLHHDGLTENWVGNPVASTWGGYKSTDRK